MPGPLSAWLILFENLESFGVRVDTSEGAEAWLKTKRTAAIKRLTVIANHAFKVRLSGGVCRGARARSLTLRLSTCYRQERDWMAAARAYTSILRLSRRHDAKFAAVCLSNRCACWLKVRACKLGT